MTADAAIGGIREVGPNDLVGVIGADSHPLYDRPPLSKAYSALFEFGFAAVGEVDARLEAVADTEAGCRHRVHPGSESL